MPKQTPTLQPEPQADLLEVLTTDEFAGRGGSYVFDPVTGKRTPQPPIEEKE